MKKIIATFLMVLGTASVQAETVKQIGFMSDYLFRGITRTDNDFAVYLKATGNVGNAYGGASIINIESVDGAEGIPAELDVNFGYNNKFDSFNIDLEVITYNFLLDSEIDETEFKIGTSPLKGLDISLYRGIKKNTWYPEVTYEKTIKYRIYLDAAVGFWLPDNSDDSALTGRVELGRDFPELYGIDIYAGVDYISDSTPFGNDNDEDDAETEFVFGVRKNF
ncbi:TorF family putative porin [Psychromonas algicola]|uniref:TorF family putative porin n=1 Tax=Psychromonas algicola TaxID=2555642 RepID=UPI0010683417|nr:TorF family putative porin [Psychromonas sp. RZ5]TEW52341.1 hypothetical protein E2R67_03250 [Psychromonas sp. RZ5]